MRKIALFFLVTLALFSCKKENTNSLNVSSTEAIEFSSIGTESHFISVESDYCNWTATSDQSWCRISKEEDGFTIFASYNPLNTPPPTATVKVMAGDATPIYIKVTQLGSSGCGGGDAILVVSPADQLQFSAEANETFILDVTTNQIYWDAVSDQPWVHITQGGTKVYITASANHSEVAPTAATITFTAVNATPVTVRVIQLASGYVYIPDNAFRTAVLNAYDTDYDSRLSFAEAAAITELIVDNKNIMSLQGIESFVNLNVFTAQYNPVREADFSHNTLLEELILDDARITKINLQGLTKLTDLSLSGTKLTSLDLSTNTELKYLDLTEVPLASIDLSLNTKLQTLLIRQNQLTSLDLRGLVDLETLYCNANQIKTLDLSTNVSLVNVDASRNQITHLNISNLPILSNLWIGYNSLTSLDLSTNPELVFLDTRDNNLSPELDISKNTKLGRVTLYNNPNLTTLWMFTGQNPTVYKDDQTVIKFR